MKKTILGIFLEPALQEEDRSSYEKDRSLYEEKSMILSV
jgi:hypothetical protein